MRKIVFTGGGTAGHVTPNLAIISKLRALDWDIHYIGSAQGIEKTIIEQNNIPFYPISSGKLRRYLDWRNVIDPFRVVKGVFDAVKWLHHIRPDIVFSKGGFVAVPVVVASWLCRIPVMIHESDMTPGLANRLCTPFAKQICVTFPETMTTVDTRKALLTGLPIREHLLHGDRANGLKSAGFLTKKPVILIIGGSLGSQIINRVVREALAELVHHYQIIHICGKGNLDEQCATLEGYVQLEYVDEQLADFFAAADMVLSRAGSTSIFECLALTKPMLLIPLSMQASRGDQILNARSFEQAGYADVLPEDQLDAHTLIQHIQRLTEKQQSMIRLMKSQPHSQASDTISKLIQQQVHN